MGGIDVNKTSKLKECGICHYWYFLNKSFKFQPNICNRCHDLLKMSMKLVILNIKSSDYCCSISGVSKKLGHQPNAKHQLDQKKQNIIKYILIYKNE